MRQGLYWTIILSLFIHLMMWTGAQYLPYERPQKNERIEVEILSPHKQRMSQFKTKSIVREALAPEQVKKPLGDDPAPFLSSQTQRVKEQTRAAETGMTQNRGSQKTSAQNPQNKRNATPDSPVPKAKLPSLQDEGLRQFVRSSNQNQMPLMPSPGISTVGENLPEDVAIGSFTALNTDRYLFYSFYARIEEQIRFRWEDRVKASIEQTSKAQLRANVRSKWVSNIEIVLSPKGEFKRAIIMKESGLRSFDEAAIAAFAEARLFPNPPKEMIDPEDGLIHLSYSFTVQLDPRLLARP